MVTVVFLFLQVTVGTFSLSWQDGIFDGFLGFWVLNIRSVALILSYSTFAPVNSLVCACV